MDFFMDFIMGKLKDIIGMRNGRLVVTRRIPKEERTGNPRNTQWECRCDCGNIHIVTPGNFHKTKSCGCYQQEVMSELHLKDIAGQIFSQLTAICRTSMSSTRGRFWECLCDCGSKTIVPIGDLTSGNTKSCGCRGRNKDITGRKFGKLTAIRNTGRRKFRSDIWEYACECGNTVSRPRCSVSNSKGGVSCGCIQQPDLSGKQFGWLTVIKYVGINKKTKNPSGMWLCKCRCGKETKATTAGIKRLRPASCGCLQATAAFLGRNSTMSPLDVPIGVTKAYKSYRKVVNKCNSILERK